jgi:hypothetical protein
MSPLIPLADLIFVTVVPYLRASPYSVSPLVTVCERPELDFFTVVVDFFFGVELAVVVVFGLGFAEDEDEEAVDGAGLAGASKA